MNFYELIYLSEEFKTKLYKCWLEKAVTPFKNQLELFITNGEESFRLVFNASQGNTALFIDSFRPAKKSNTHHFFDSIYGKPIVDICLKVNERILSFKFEHGYTLWFKLFSSKANVLLSNDHQIIESFKDRNLVGNSAPHPISPMLFNTDSITGEDQIHKIQKLLPILPKKWILQLDGIHDFESLNDVELIDFLKNLDEQLRIKAEFRILENGATSLIPRSILSIPTESTTETVNELIQYRFKNYAHDQRLNQQKNEILKGLKRQIKRLESSLKNLAKADKGLDKADKYEKLGHILMANAHLNHSNQNSIELDDLYNQGSSVHIPLNADLTIAENAQRYYSRASNSIKSFEEAEKRTPILEQKKSEFAILLQEIESINDIRKLNDWKKQNRSKLEGILQTTVSQQEQNIPFYVLDEMGYTIWIGKNSRNNDELVQKAHKEDVWLHARGVPGSHVLIRMNNSKEMPDMSLIEEVASFAAHQSKAKGSSIVPVIYTKRKYIRKLKGGAPGTVLVQKENVVIVEPKNPF